MQDEISPGWTNYYRWPKGLTITTISFWTRPQWPVLPPPPSGHSIATYKDLSSKEIYSCASYDNLIFIIFFTNLDFLLIWFVLCSLYNEARKITAKIRLSDFFLKTDVVQRKDNYDSFTRGLLTQHAQGQDEFFTEEVQKFNILNSSEDDFV